jgi:hypothetical protein
MHAPSASVFVLVYQQASKLSTSICIVVLVKQVNCVPASGPYNDPHNSEDPRVHLPVLSPANACRHVQELRSVFVLLYW